jgi:hypothetical protein
LRLRHRLGLVVLVAAGGLDAGRNLVVVLATQGGLEVAKSATERAADFWQSLRAKDQKRDYQDEDQVRRLEDVAHHSDKAYRVAGPGEPGVADPGSVALGGGAGFRRGGRSSPDSKLAVASTARAWL